jgi:hypothetical protein
MGCSGQTAKFVMVGTYFSDAVHSSNGWIAAGYLLSPLVAGSLFGGAFAYIVRWLGWLPNVTSIKAVSMMLGVLSYVVMTAVNFLVLGSFTPQAIWLGILAGLIFNWPIAFVMGPTLFIYIVNLKKGQKTLKDSTVFYIAVLCLISEFAFWILFFNEA